MRKFYSLLFLAAAISSCAIKVNPEGGPKDVTPPVILSCEPANQSSNIKPTDIEISFDEFVTLKDLNTQLVTSPLLKYTPETKIRRKSLYIHLKDTLKENTTYTLNFGKAIVDLNEGNALEGYQYVFSTGPVIDTLKMKGNLTYAIDHHPEKDILVMLYGENTDSLPYKERPLYVGRTNEQGDFHIDNVTPGKYKIFALKESDADYLYSGSPEKIAFADGMFDAGSENIKLKLFEEIPSLHFLKAISEFPGKVSMVFSAPADTFAFHWLTDTNALKIYSKQFSSKKDTLTFWYKNLSADSLSFINPGKYGNDTIAVRLFKLDPEKKEKKYTLDLSLLNAGLQALDLRLPLTIKSNRLLQSADVSKCSITADSIPVKFSMNIDSVDQTKLTIVFERKAGMKYRMLLLPGALTDIFGLKNDSLEQNFTFRSEGDYGTLTVNYTNGGEGNFIQLLNSEDKVSREVAIQNEGSVNFDFLLPGFYRLRFVNDKNRNGQWDTGNYLRHEQPEETIYSAEAINIRSNWDVDVKWKIVSSDKK